MGGISGLVVAVALTDLGKGIFGRHPELGRLQIELPSLPIKGIMTGSPFPSFVPWALAAALSLIAVVALASRVRTRR